MAITVFTSYADIRAALGVGIAEIPDAVISLPLYENNLGVELDKLSLTLETDFVVTTALAVKTAAQTRFLRSVQLFATYVVARQLTGALPLFSPKEIHDGKASMIRYASNPYEATVKAVKEAFEAYKAGALAAYAALGAGAASTDTTLRPYLSVVAPSYDPVTGA